ncbi:hypothetical protein [Halococcus sediminicola]|uniref:hypothetical protein n=1 Tax=Halococcus sediminicola TaxID=1264579 RepID=UPI0006795DA7|nr:hypothetical protein [Halococcus sediminicola]
MSEGESGEQVFLDDVLKKFSFYGDHDQLEKLAAFFNQKMRGASTRTIKDETTISYPTQKRIQSAYDELSQPERVVLIRHLAEASL